jgi:hypothetical protein
VLSHKNQICSEAVTEKSHSVVIIKRQITDHTDTPRVQLALDIIITADQSSRAVNDWHLFSPTEIFRGLTSEPPLGQN